MADTQDTTKLVQEELAKQKKQIDDLERYVQSLFPIKHQDLRNRGDISHEDIDYHVANRDASRKHLTSALATMVATIATYVPWTSHTITLTGSVTNPTLGTGGSATSQYLRIGGLVVFQGICQFGSAGTNQGSGTYSVTLPVTAATSQQAPGIAHIINGAGRITGLTIIASSTTLNWYSTGSSVYGSGAPGAWGANDQLAWTTIYRAA